MKLRIYGNSLRLRLGPSEIDALLKGGRIDETIRFGAEESAKLTYALELADAREDISLRYQLGEVAVLISRHAAQEWSQGDRVGIADCVSTGQGTLDLLIEKDFACLDHKTGESEDTFPNPKAGAAC